jgi:DNA-binding transcriptional MerR regulator
MFSIGDFAKLGRVSIRMLRHYDTVGLLEPAHVDPFTGYRSYDAGQLRRLNRVVALKDLGFTLQQVRTILDEPVGFDELRGMLRLRRAQLEAQLSADTSRLARVEARLRLIESEGKMTTTVVETKSIPAVRVVGLSAVAASYDPADIGPTIQPLYPQLIERLEKAGVEPVGPSIAFYSPASEVSEDAVNVRATFPVGPHDVEGLESFDLPAIEAATIVHHGSMDGVDETYQTLTAWIEDHGHRATGYAREVYLACPDDIDAWVTELQIPLDSAP